MFFIFTFLSVETKHAFSPFDKYLANFVANY